MSVTGLNHISEQLLNQVINQTTTQGTNTATTAVVTNGSEVQESGIQSTDEFIPSTQVAETAQAAGLYTTPAPGNTPAVALSNPAPQTAAPTANAANTANVNTNTDTGATTATNLNPPTTTATEQQLQTLNNALAALGLSDAEIQQIDNIASQINEFNPPVFTNLIQQFEVLAQQLQQQAGATANPTAAAATGNAALAAATVPTTAATANAVNFAAVNANGNGASPNGQNGFELQEIVITYQSAQAQANLATNNANGNGQNAGGNAFGSVQAAAFSLQIQEVQLTLTNSNGQTLQVQSPPSTANAFAQTTSPAPAPLAQAAGA